MYLPKLSNEEIGCYHTPATRDRMAPAKNGEMTRIRQMVDPAALQSDCEPILAQIARLEALHAESAALCRRIRDSVQALSAIN